MFIVNLCILLLVPLVSPQHNGVNLHARCELDSLLRDYAFRAFFRPRTGNVYQGLSPSNLTDIQVAALRLRTGSLWRRGVSRYNEFRIPMGILIHPYVERVAFVYQNLGNSSSYFYNLNGFTFLAPVLGLLAYDASNLSATDLLPLEIGVTGDPILVNFSGLVSISFSGGISTKCVYFSLNGSFELSAVVNRSSCLFSNQGHFSIVSEASSLNPPPPTGVRGGRRVWVIVGTLIGGAILVFIIAVAIWDRRNRKKIQRMEASALVGVLLPMIKVGETKAPAAPEMRTKPTIETEFAP